MRSISILTVFVVYRKHLICTAKGGNAHCTLENAPTECKCTRCNEPLTSMTGCAYLYRYGYGGVRCGRIDWNGKNARFPHGEDHPIDPSMSVYLLLLAKKASQREACPGSWRLGTEGFSVDLSPILRNASSRIVSSVRLHLALPPHRPRSFQTSKNKQNQRSIHRCFGLDLAFARY